MIEQLDESFWQYFLVLESDFNKTIQYVDLSIENDETFSLEFARQLICISIELEAVAKKLCKVIDENANAGNISNYKSIMLSKYPNICSAPVYIDRYKRTIYPFMDWEKGVKLTWWDAYQHVKHHRSKYFKEANIKNVLSALSSLLLLELYLYGTVYPTCDKRKSGTILLRAPGMVEQLFCQSEEDLPDLPKVLPSI